MYTKKELDDVGDVLVQKPQDEDALKVLNEWRSLHTYFLQDVIFNTPCNPKDLIGSDVYDFSISISSRPKRAAAIIDKLQRMPRLKLSRMQDIVGVRYVLKSSKPLIATENNWFADFVAQQADCLSETFEIERTSDYINKPRATGYRGYHFILKYNNTSSDFNGLRFELQIRTHYQHLWAMAVEMVDMVYGKTLKTSKENDLEGWSDFFRCVSALFACRENMPVPNIKVINDDRSIHNEVMRLGREKTFFTKLSMISNIANSPALEHCAYWVLEVDVKRHCSKSRGYDKLSDAVALCEAREQNPDCLRGDVNVVLVSAQGFRDIREAYPSYFLDIGEFLSLIK
jgi:ppGpp synthetase/RelA/SpoT-type nucleotidyltranferase